MAKRVKPVVNQVDEAFLHYKERPETNIVMCAINDIDQVRKMFGNKLSNGATPVVLVPSRSSCSWYITVPAGASAIMTKNGRNMGLFAPGYYWLPPWWSIAYLVSTQSIPYHFHVRECATKDNVYVQVHIDMVFHIVDPIKFVFNIGPEQMEELLRATQAESVRALVRSVTVDRAYDLRGNDTGPMVAHLNDKLLEPYGVSVDLVSIASITLPKNIALAIQNETTFDSKQREQRKRQEFEMKVQNDKNYLMRVEQDRQNERLKADETALRAREVLLQQMKELQANSSKTIAEIGAEEQHAVSAISGKTNVEIGEIRAEADRLAAQTRAKGENAAASIRAESDKRTKEILTTAQVQVTRNAADGVRAQAAAEADAASKLRAKREYEVEARRVAAIDKLAGNKHLAITTDSGQNVIAQYFASQQTAATLGLIHSS